MIDQKKKRKGQELFIFKRLQKKNHILFFFIRFIQLVQVFGEQVQVQDMGGF
jgi:hypothetical protein